MKENKICFISCVNDQQLYNEALYYIDQLEVPKGYEIECISIENANSMTAGYNKAMGASDAKYKVYMHQDVYIRNRSFINIMLDILTSNRNIGIIGLTGTKVIPVNGTCNECSQKYGQAYSTQTGVIKLLAYNEVISEYEKVQAVDGFIMVTQYDIPWREDIFDGWSFYDISQSLEFMKAGYEVVIPKQEETWVIHEASGSNTGVEFEDYCNIFMEEYPKDIIETFIYDIEKENNILNEAAIVWRNYYVTKTNDKEYVKPIDDYIINKFNLHSEKISDLFDFDKISALEIVNNNKNEFLRYVNNAKNSLHNRNYEEASKWCFEGARYASENHPGFYTSPELEKILMECAGHVPQSNYKLDIPPINSKRRKVLHVLSEGYSTGGHTRLVKNWIEKDSDSIHSIITTWQIDTTPMWLTNAAKESGGWAYSLQQLANFIDRSSVLREIAYEWADIVVLHVHMFDPIPIMAFGVEGGPPVLFMNHGDHVFWIGTSIIDNLVNFRESGRELSKIRRNICRTSLLPLPLESPDIKNQNKKMIRKQLGIDENAIVLLTIATPYKFTTFGEIHYIDLLKMVLDKNKNTVAIVIGPDNVGKWKKANEDTDGRILPLGMQNDIGQYYCISNIYIDSYMFGSITSALDGGIHGLPIVALENSNNKTLSFNDMSTEGLNKKLTSSEDFLNCVNILINNAEYRDQKGQETSGKIKKDHIHEWNGYLDIIYKKVENRSHKIYLNTEFKNKLGNEDLFLAMFHKSISSGKKVLQNNNITKEKKDIYEQLKNLMVRYFNEEKLVLSQILGEHLITYNPKDYNILNVLALTHYKKNEIVLAKNYLTEAIKHCPKDSEIILNYVKLNGIEESEKFLDENHSANKGNIEYLKYYNVIKKQGEFNKLFRDGQYQDTLNLYNSFNSIKAKLLKVTTVKDFCQKNSCKYMVMEEEEPREIFIPHYHKSRKMGKIKQFTSPEIYIAELEDVNIIGENSVIIADDYCLYDMAKRDYDNRFDLRYGSLRSIDKNYAIVGFTYSNKILEEAAFLVGFAPYNYYHFTIELLSRMQYIDSFEEYRPIPILIDEKALKIPQHDELIKAVNKFNHPIIPVKRNYMYKVKKLIYPSYNTWMPINIKAGTEFKYEDQLIADSAINFIRDSVLKNVIKNGHRKIFISRKKLANARLINEEAVTEIFKQHGFEIIYPEELTFNEQVKVFSEAEYVAGATGAAFTNILYCPQNVKIICIIPQKYKFYIYSTISKRLNYQCIFLDAEVIEKKHYYSSEQFKLDLNYCEDFLKSLKLYKKSDSQKYIMERIEEIIDSTIKVYRDNQINYSVLNNIENIIKQLIIINICEKDMNEFFQRLKYLNYIIDIMKESMLLSNSSEIENMLNILYKNINISFGEDIIIEMQPLRHKRALERVKKKKIVKVAFFAIYSSVWKYDEVYQLMEQDPRFDPIVVVCPVVNYGKENMLEEMGKSYSFFENKGYNVIRTYNQENDIYLDVKQEINPDIIFYTNPYQGLIMDKYYITNFKDTLTCYTNYAFYVSNRHKEVYGQLFNSILWKTFYETTMHVRMAKEYDRNKGNHVVVTGYPGMDNFVYGIRSCVNVWKNPDENLKRIIWAPHHTIDLSGDLRYSNFLHYHQTMLNIAEEYKNRVQIAFKPHPLLKVKLYNHVEWGKERTEKYYNLWEINGNTQLETDEYIDLFNSSDAMILDSGSFTVEYLCCGKPSLFTFSDLNIKDRFNEFGKLALDQHYHAYNKNDIISFVDHVCNEEDIKKVEREKFYKKYLVSPNNKSASENIYEEICKQVF